MIKYKTSFVDIHDFIQHLKKNKDIVGIVEYGGRTFKDMSIGGDYDLTIIFDKPVSNNFTGVHFHIQDIPVDCMILSKEDFLTEKPSNIFLLVHLNCTILYDKDNITLNLLNKIKDTWKKSVEPSDFDKMLYRFTFGHIIDKLRYRLYEDELYTKYFIYSSIEWFLSSYSNLKGWEIGKPKLHLKLVKENDPLLYKLIAELYEDNSLDKKFDLLSKCAEYMLKSIGGVWQKEEALFHLAFDGVNDEKEQLKFLDLLMKKEETQNN